MALFPWLSRKRYERAGFSLYTAAVRAARDPFFYDRLGVPDTLDGRFDMVGAFVFLLIDRLRAAPAPGPELAQAVFDAMFSDMDHALREMGVSDIGVGRRNKAMWEALHGRSQAYAGPLRAGDEGALAEALARNVWRGAAADGNARTLAGIIRRQHQLLEAQSVEQLARGQVEFAPPAPVPA